MRRLPIVEGRGHVEVRRGRGDVRYGECYYGQVTRMTNGRWRHQLRPHLSFRGPAEAAEDIIDATHNRVAA